MAFKLTKPKIERVALVGEYEGNWIDYNPVVTTRTALGVGALKDTTPERQAAAAFATLITAWSFLDENGDPLPITLDNFLALPADMLTPFFEHVNDNPKAGKPKKQG